MAKPQGFDVSNTKPPSMIIEHEQEANHVSDDYYSVYNDEEAVFGNSCGCFRFFSYFDNHHRDGESTAFIHHRSGDVIMDNETWLMNRFKSLKEFSELLAGPKWKNFIRKFSKKPKKGTSSFQYDPESYALNFNDCGADDDMLPHSFSTRFAPHSRSMSS